MEQHHILRCQFARDLTTIVQVGGLGVEDSQKIPDITYLRHFFSRDWPDEEVCLSKPRPLRGLNSILEIILALFPLISRGKVLGLCFPVCTKLCDVFRNVAFRLADIAI